MTAFSSPYPGLRPFDADEGDLFFGREDQVDELLRRLHTTRFLAVVGPSGCGKSSLVRAGMIAALQSGFLVSAGSRWQVAVMRPGGRPMTELATALATQTGLAHEDAEAGQDTTAAIGLLGATLRRGPLGLVEALRETPLDPGTNLLVLVDQFEEIFRFRREGGSDEADAFVALLLESARQREVPVYVVLTMRSDFFGDCAAFADLPEALNRSQYLTPRLSREQRRAAITGPARVFGGDVATDVVNRLLNEMGNDPDQLPLMQHLLMRMWTWKTPPAADVATEEVSPGHTLTIDDYAAVGGLRHALSDHANEAFDRLDERQQAIAQTLFRRLSERAPGSRDIRRPTRAEEAAELAGVTVAELIAVADVFRAPGCSFVVPGWPAPIDGATVLDITHEALIRQWDQLRLWADDEAQSRDQYRFLERNAQLWKQKHMALWGTPNLEMALDWRSRAQPSVLWASRYGGDFRLAMAFLDQSAEARAEAENAVLIQRRRQVLRLRRVTAVSVIAALLCFGAAGGAWWFLFAEHVAYYKNVVKHWGEPVGVDALNAGDVRHRKESLKFVQRGIHHESTSPWYFRFTTNEIDAVDAEGACTPDNDVGTYLSESGPDFSPVHECRWVFVRDSTTGEIVYENAYDKNGHMRQGYQYLVGQNDRTSRQAYYVGPDGSLAHFSNSPASVVRMTYSDRGEEIRRDYLDRDNRPQPGPDHAYGRAIRYDSDGREIAETSLDEFGDNVNDTAGNATAQTKYDAAGNDVSETAFDAKGQPTFFKSGYQENRQTFDQYGNLTSWAVFYKDGRPALTKNGVHLVKYTLDDEGRVRGFAYFDREDKATLSTEGFHRVDVIALGPNGRRADWAFFDTEGHNATDRDGVHEYRSTYGGDGFLSSERAFGADGQPIAAIAGCYESRVRVDKEGNLESQACFDKNGKPALYKDGEYQAAFLYDDRGHIVERKYFDREGAPTTINEGFHRQATKYDLFGNPEETTTFDIENHPVDNTGHYQREAATYDRRGNQISHAYYDANKQLVPGPDGFARETAIYDDRDSPIEVAYYDADNHLTETSKAAEGYAIERREFDDRWRETKAAFFDRYGNPVMRSKGYTTRRISYVGDFEDQSYFDMAGKLVKIDGCAIWRDTIGNTAGKALYSFCLDEDRHGIAADNGVSVVRTTYDDQGRILEFAFTDTADRPALGPEGAAFVRQRYDSAGHNTEVAYYGVDGRPVAGPQGAASMRAQYDGAGHRIEWSQYDEAGKLILGNSDHAIERDQFDEHGNRTELAYFGINGEPIVASNGYHRMVDRRDERGNLIERRLYGEDGALITLPEGYAIERDKYDNHGRQIDDAYFGPNEEPALISGNYHRGSFRYDERGNPIEHAFYGVDDKLWLNPKEGYAVERTRYDDQDRVVERAYLGPDGGPIALDGRYHRRVWNYTGTGNNADEFFYDVDNRLFQWSNQGFAMLRAERVVYGQDGRLIAHCMIGATEAADAFLQCLDPEGHPVARRVVVQKLVAGGQAEKLGIRPGDILDSYSGQDIIEADDLARIIAMPTEGKRELVVQRDTQHIEFTVMPGRVGVYLEIRFVPTIVSDAGRTLK